MEISSKLGPEALERMHEALDLAKRVNTQEFLARADELRKKAFGNKFETCSIMNARSGRCPENCKWCAQSAHNHTDAEVYPLVSAQEAIDFAKVFSDAGVKRFSLVTSGRTLSDSDVAKTAEIFKRLKKEMNIGLCGSLGLLTKSQLQILKDAGMTRYHCNLETAPSNFANLCTTHTMEDKLQTIYWAKEIGLQICSGGIIGMGETFEQRAELAAKLWEIGAMSIPVNILIPIKGTPLYGTPDLPDEEILKSLAIFRIINPDAQIRFAGGRLKIRHIQREALKCGVSAALVGDMLTTAGAGMKDDFDMLAELGYEYR